MDVEARQSVEPEAAAKRWLSAFEAALRSADTRVLALLFAGESHWRDILAFTWRVQTVSGETHSSKLQTALRVTFRIVAAYVKLLVSGSRWMPLGTGMPAGMRAVSSRDDTNVVGSTSSNASVALSYSSTVAPSWNCAPKS